MANWLFALAFAGVYYINGAGFVESFVNYPSWALLSESDFSRYHQFITPRVIGFLVIPVVLTTVLTALLLWRRPAPIPGWSVWSALALQAIAWISTFTIQLPIQEQLAQGLSVDLLEQLMESNLWLRRVPIGLCAALFLWMATRVLAGGYRSN